MPARLSQLLGGTTSSIANRVLDFIQLGAGERKQDKEVIAGNGEQVRNAVRYKTAAGHRFERTLHKEPTYCAECGQFIWGLLGLGCKMCKMVSHAKCIDSVTARCVANQIEMLDHCAPSPAFCADQQERKSHHFKSETFGKPRFCDHCGTLLIGLLNQGVKCDSDAGGCGRTVHHECKPLVCHPCHTKTPVGNHRSSVTGEQSMKSTEALTPDERPDVLEQATYDNTLGKVRLEDFELLRILNFGTFGKVYLARLRRDGREFAIKTVKKTSTVVSGDPDSAFAERTALQLGRRYPFLTVAHCCFQSRDRLFYVMEHVPGEHLLACLDRDSKFSESRVRFYGAEITLALRFLHAEQLLYRDLKLENVMLDRRGHCKLVDFGLSKELYKTENQSTRTFCGTPICISPEVIREEAYGYSVDWWALGVCMYEMLTGYPPFYAKDDNSLFRMILKDQPDIPRYLSVEAANIIEQLLIKDPQNRLGCRILECCEEALLQHEFFRFPGDNGGAPIHRWSDIQSLQMRPPYVPNNRRSTSSTLDNSHECPPISDVDKDEVNKIAQHDYKGFSCCSSSFLASPID